MSRAATTWRPSNFEPLVDCTSTEAERLTIEYDPRLPFDCGTPGKRGDLVMARLQAYCLRRQRSPGPTAIRTEGGGRS
jgi:hypothetical protein